MQLLHAEQRYADREVLSLIQGLRSALSPTTRWPISGDPFFLTQSLLVLSYTWTQRLGIHTYAVFSFSAGISLETSLFAQGSRVLYLSWRQPNDSNRQVETPMGKLSHLSLSLK